MIRVQDGGDPLWGPFIYDGKNEHPTFQPANAACEPSTDGTETAGSNKSDDELQ